MKVYWIEDEEGLVYGNARYFKRGCVPKLYGSRKKIEDIFGNDSRYKWTSRTIIIKEGTLTCT